MHLIHDPTGYISQQGGLNLAMKVLIRWLNLILTAATRNDLKDLVLPLVARAYISFVRGHRLKSPLLDLIRSLNGYFLQQNVNLSLP